VKLFRSSDFLPEYNFLWDIRRDFVRTPRSNELQYLDTRQSAVDDRCATACLAVVLTGLTIDAHDCREVGRPSDRWTWLISCQGHQRHGVRRTMGEIWGRYKTSTEHVATRVRILVETTADIYHDNCFMEQ
jgi:hypothetical protein